MFIVDNVGSAEPVCSYFSQNYKKIQWGVMLVLSVIIYGSHAPLISLCKVNGEIPFSSTSVVLLIELYKFIVSVSLLLIWDRKSTEVLLSWRLALPYTLPALLYCVNNNLVVHMQHFMDPSSFQVLSNLKIVSTALLYSLFLNQRLSINKWFALFLLLAAGVFYSYGGIQGVENLSPDTHLYVTLTGLFLMLLYCVISGLSAVYTEIILKTQSIPLNMQNIFLYTFGIVINLTAHLTSSHEGSFFKGFSVWVLVIIFSQAVNGLIMSAVMKHSSNITRLFIISFSMLVNGLLSFFMFNLQLTILFYLAVILIGSAVYLYYGVK
ncbi:probable UDP-sugar transporter protein SLC35A4 [Bombina bombina]|uniref:probable UDP-sugar transporter protein SLC35A4 n=1 Tax=Bombina bombina TaxID=8345 RepID=UPI00235A8D03|nr:probable UDP-sugar transporter protein SLC35A4 [Bombina bombina]